MWRATKIASTDTKVTFGIEQKGTAVSYRQFLDLLRNSSSFRSFYNQQLADSDFDAFLWENKAVSETTMSQPYEVTLLNNTFLANQSPDEHTFRPYFDTNKQVVIFPNLGKDAQLIAPCPHKSSSCYTHIGTFIRKAGTNQQDTMWRIVGEQMTNAIGDKPRWLSTNGLGVFWLHIRIDRRPKYYQTEKYKHK